MNKFGLLALLGVLILGAGIAFAITGAGTNAGTAERWDGTQSAGSVAIGSGNITNVNVSASDQQTNNFAAFWGNASGSSIVLRDAAGTSDVYTWAISPAAGGEVCVAINDSFDFVNSVAAIATAIDSAFGINTSDGDRAETTYKDGTGTLTFGVTTTPSLPYALTGGGFNTYALNDTGLSGEQALAFCTEIDAAGTAFNGQPAAYELIVPTSPISTETYYFFIELQ